MASILVIDDQEPIRRIVRRALENERHAVLDASDGELGMQILERETVDVVITDIFMPGLDGIQTLREIRRRFPAVRVIAMSGGDSTGLLDPKPWTSADLLERVRQVLDGVTRSG